MKDKINKICKWIGIVCLYCVVVLMILTCPTFQLFEYNVFVVLMKITLSLVLIGGTAGFVWASTYKF